MENGTRSPKEDFCRIYNGAIKRHGADKLLEWLNVETDFFEAPASTTHHCAYRGGLVEHSLHVYDHLEYLYDGLLGGPQDGDTNRRIAETLAICGLLHDVCKVNSYTQELKRKRVNGEWIDAPTWVYNNGLPMGHGEKSVYLVQRFMPLTETEAMAIRWHMGMYDAAAKTDSRDLGQAMKMEPLVLLLHQADMQATYLAEAEDCVNE